MIARLPEDEAVATGIEGRAPYSALRVFKNAEDLRRGVCAFCSIDCERSRFDELGEVVSSGKVVKLSVHRHPPFAVARLQRQALADPTEVFPLQRVGHKPREPLPVVTPERLPVGDLARMQQVNLTALEDARTLIAWDVAPEADTTGAVGQNPAHRIDAVLLAISDKAFAHQLHRSGGIRAQPEISARVFVNRRDFLKA